jgi:hypothetical protein
VAVPRILSDPPIGGAVAPVALVPVALAPVAVAPVIACRPQLL